MFTLRFMRGDFESVVSGVRYEKHIRYGNTDPDTSAPILNATISVYPALVGEGVDFNIHGPKCASSSEFDVCFVENAQGKTIDRIGPFD